MQVTWNNADSWCFIGIYGSPHSSIRSELWEGIYNLATNVNGPWCIRGDFNPVLSLNDVGNDQHLACDSTVFNRCMLDNGLFDMGFCGQPYTWQRRNLRRRLDRMIANAAWSNRFKEAVIRHLPKLKCDHIPLLIDLIWLI